MKNTFYLRKPKGDKETLILFSAYFKNEGKKLIYSTGETIHPKEWDLKNRMPNNLNGRGAKADNQRAIKRQLDRYSSFYIEIMNRYINSGQDLTIGNIRKEFDKNFKKTTSKANTFFGVYDEFVDSKVKSIDWSLSTIKRYKNLKNMLIDFEENKKYNLSFNTINDKFYSEFTDYCMNVRGHINNTFSRNVGLFKTFMYWSLKERKTYKADFISFKKKPKVITSQIALRKDDLIKLINFNFGSKRLEKVSDVFVFSCVTGLRFGELKLISKSNVKNNAILLKEEKATGKKAREIHLNQLAMFLLMKYDYKLPLIANQKHNDYIKEVFKEVGYTNDVEKTTTKGKEIIRETMPFYKRISTHTARRTFITMMKRKGKSDKLIAEITGHSDMKTLNAYYQISNTDVKDAVNDTFDFEMPLKKVE